MKETIQSAPRCVHCYQECPNGIEKYPFLVVCQRPGCPNYGLFQAGDQLMEQLQKKFPIK